MIIKITQDACICSGEYRLHTDDGKPSICALSDWYEASATDDNGAEYRVIWRIRVDYDSTCGDESDACDWSEPAEIIRLDDGANVTDSVQIAW